MKKIIIVLSIIIIIGISFLVFYPTSKETDSNVILLYNGGADLKRKRAMRFIPKNPKSKYLIKRDGGTILIHSLNGKWQYNNELNDFYLPNESFFFWIPTINSKDTHYLAIFEEKSNKIVTYSVFKITKNNFYYAELIKSKRINFPMKYKNNKYIAEIEKYIKQYRGKL